jgi:hypothetical protein
MKKPLHVALIVIALSLLPTACKESAGPKPAGAPAAVKSEKQPATLSPAKKETTATPPASTNAPRQVLIFRNVRSWNRKMDFEEALANLAFHFEVKSSAEMEKTDLTPYLVVIIPGAQWQNDYYRDYAANASRFDRYVTNGGTLVLELNGAERDGITLPGGANMVAHGARENILTRPDHPILEPLAGQPIHASYASHGYLVDLPKEALVLVTESAAGRPVPEKPTFVEYAHGTGRVIAACQCFHDQDGSGRGPLLATVLSYAAEKEWFSPKK